MGKENVLWGESVFNRFRMKINAKSVSFKWMLSYFIFIVFFIISTLVSVCFFYNVYKTEIIRSNSYILDAAKNDYEYVFGDIMDIINRTFSKNNRIYSYIPSDDSDNDKEYKYYLIKKELANIVQSKELYEQAFLYLEKFDVIVSINNVLSTELYYKAYIEKTGTEYNEWIDLIKQDTHNSVVLNKTNDEHNKYYYVNKTVISMITRNEEVSLVFVLNNDYIDNINEKIYATNHSSILMSDGTKYVNFSQNENADAFDEKNIKKKGDFSYIYLNGKKHICMMTEFSLDRNYILLIPLQTFYGSLISVLIFQCVLLLLISLMMVYMSVYFSKLHLAPVKKLMEMLDSKYNNSSENEYDEISQLISKMIANENSIKKKLAKQDEYFYRDIVIRWIKGDISVRSFEERGIHLASIGLTNERFISAVFEITDIEDENKGMVDYEIAKYALNNVMSELISEKYCCYSVDMNGLLVFIINPPNEQPDKKIKSILFEIYQYAKEFIKNNLYFEFKMAVGNLKDDADELHYSYNEATSLLEYSITYGEETVFRDVSESSAQNMLGALFRETNKLVSGIKNSDMEQIKLYADSWSKLYITYRAKSPNTMQYSLYALIDAVLRECMALNSNGAGASSFVDYLTEKYRFENAKNYEAVRTELSDMLLEIHDFINDQTDENDLESQIRTFIEENYCDSNLNVAMIAEHFDINVTYLSSFFKKNHGCGILETINKLRCDKSTALLTGTNNKIEDIAKSVGYTNSYTYMRVFKKYYFMTPTEYRKNNKKVDKS